MAKIVLPIKKGTKAAYDALSTKDAGTVYILTDVNGENNLFLGAIPIGKGSDQKVIKDVSFDQTTSVFTYTCTDGTTKTVDLVLESVIKDISYNGDTNLLTFTLVGGATTDIDLSDLIGIYDGTDTDSVDVTVAGGIISAAVKLSNTAGNALSIETGKGMYVNISGKADRVANAVADNIVSLTADGNIKDSGKSVTTAISDTPSDSKIPTEKATHDLLAASLVIGSF